MSPFFQRRAIVMYPEGPAVEETAFPFTLIFSAPFVTQPGYRMSSLKGAVPAVMVSLVLSS
jgi:hypothetical protein